ncbi:MAG: ATP-binding cassette domain-containing protein [Synergistaceae bacterium]|jgi:oligopeptide transport system ATP-binding protein|nr:ATP-binding cassette domain-containing protein [Synergistaceae bacterium]
MSEELLGVRDLKTHFAVRDSSPWFGACRILKAVDGVSFGIGRGKTFGLVGESGCGKTTVGRTILRLYRPAGGEIVFGGTDLAALSEREFFPYRRRMQMIFQDPFTSLDPRQTVGEIIGAPLSIHGLAPTRAARAERVRELVGMVGLRSDHIGRYPHEFSGGQRQRIGIARALASMPEFIVCDEPVSSLDVSIQAQIINLLEEFQERFGLTYLFISHDLSVVRHISHRVGVMYLGVMVETADVDELYGNMLHPYTKSLMSAVPTADPEIAKTRRRIILEGDVPSPLDPPSGCPFRTRCREAEGVCAERNPRLTDVGSGHMVACHKVELQRKTAGETRSPSFEISK